MQLFLCTFDRNEVGEILETRQIASISGKMRESSHMWKKNHDTYKRSGSVSMTEIRSAHTLIRAVNMKNGSVLRHVIFETKHGVLASYYSK